MTWSPEETILCGVKKEYAGSPRVVKITKKSIARIKVIKSLRMGVGEGCGGRDGGVECSGGTA